MKRDYYIVQNCSTGSTPTITGSSEYTFTAINSPSNFTPSRAFILNLPSGVTRIEYLIVGGGGAGGGASTNNTVGGGGGAGAFIEDAYDNPPAGEYKFEVGNLGFPNSAGQRGGDGSYSRMTAPSPIGTITANGGIGGAGTAQAVLTNSGNGSGGGGSSVSTRNVGAAGGTYGFSGGTGTVTVAGAGGGGAGGAGSAATLTTGSGGNGGGAGKTPTYFPSLGEIAKGGISYLISGSANTNGQNMTGSNSYGSGGGGAIRISSSGTGGNGEYGIIKFKIYWS
jgi:hypothetical protein